MRSRALLLAPLALSAALLAGCGGKPPPLTATPQGYVVTIDDDVDDLADATEKAQIHCAQYGRAARLDNVGEIDGKRLASFSCLAN